MLKQRLLMIAVVTLTLNARAKTRYDLSAMNGEWVGKSCVTQFHNTGHIQETDGKDVNYGKPVTIVFDRKAQTLKATLVSSLYLLTDLRQIDGEKMEDPINYAYSQTWIQASTSSGKISVVKWNTVSGASPFLFERNTEIEQKASMELKKTDQGMQLVIKNINYVDNDKYTEEKCILERAL